MIERIEQAYLQRNSDLYLHCMYVGLG